MSDRDELATVSASTEVAVQQGTDAVVVSDLAFTELPSVMWDYPPEAGDELRSLHIALLDGLRRDAQHLLSGTLAAMQLERVATFYIKIRWHETHGGWNRQDRNFYMKLYRDAANDLSALNQSKKISPDELHQIVSQHTAKVIAKVLRTMPAEQAQPLFRQFAEALDESAP